jgi:hypothetical protein
VARVASGHRRGYLGSGDVESYGLSLRTEGTSGFITNSVVSHLYYGLYTYEVDGLRVQDNEFFDNVLYGIDPHTGSSNLVIEHGNTIFGNRTGLAVTGAEAIEEGDNQLFDNSEADTRSR